MTGFSNQMFSRPKLKSFFFFAFCFRRRFIDRRDSWQPRPLKVSAALSVLQLLFSLQHLKANCFLELYE